MEKRRRGYWEHELATSTSLPPLPDTVAWPTERHGWIAMCPLVAWWQLVVDWAFKEQRRTRKPNWTPTWLQPVGAGPGGPSTSSFFELLPRMGVGRPWRAG